MAEIRKVAARTPRLEGAAAARAAVALAMRGRADAIDLAAARAEFAVMMGRDTAVPAS